MWYTSVTTVEVEIIKKSFDVAGAVGFDRAGGRNRIQLLVGVEINVESFTLYCFPSKVRTVLFLCL